MQRLDELRRRYDRRVSVIGWSLGGVYARELARAFPSAVRQVITLASPYRNLEATNIPAFLLARRREHPDEAVLRERLQAPLPVPVTAIYSRSDGITAWQSCAVDPGAYSENIEVDSSHLGIAHHPAVLLTIADRLAQAEGGVEAVSAAARVAMAPGGAGSGGVRPERAGLRTTTSSRDMRRRAWGGVIARSGTSARRLTSVPRACA